MAAVLHLGTAHLARVVVLKRQDSGETKARHYHSALRRRRALPAHGASRTATFSLPPCLAHLLPYPPIYSSLHFVWHSGGPARSGPVSPSLSAALDLRGASSSHTRLTLSLTHHPASQVPNSSNALFYFDKLLLRYSYRLHKHALGGGRRGSGRGQGGGGGGRKLRNLMDRCNQSGLFALRGRLTPRKAHILDD